MYNKILLSSVAAVSILITGCAQQNQKQTIGGILGGVGGGLIGTQIGSGTGRTVATIAGAVVGGYLGSTLGAQLDESDRIRAQNTASESLEQSPNGRTSTWTNPNNGNTGSFTPVATSFTKAGAPCRLARSTVTINGQKRAVESKFCRQNDGTWNLESERIL
ncbi:MAG: RT0821/Lpp0805 family surface protein [Alphaproteobacteria bacterium]